MPNGVQKVGYILPQGNLASRALYNPSGYVLVGLSDSLAKTFTTREAAVKHAVKAGLTLKTPGHE
jgi:hypothetical protein